MNIKSRTAKIVALIVLCCLAIAGIGRQVAAEDKKYEIEVSDDSHATDARRILGAYERLMERYISMVEHDLVTVKGNSGEIIKRLDSIEKKLDCLAERLAAVEKHLGAKDNGQTAESAGTEEPAKQTR